MNSDQMIWVLPVLAAALLPALLSAERSERRGVLVAVKGSMSALFVLFGLLQHPALDGLRLPVLVGLVLCLTGDVLLALPGSRAFLGGLVAFLLGHVAYLVGFLGWASPRWALLGLMPLAAIALAVHRWLAPLAGRLLWPVRAYILVITAMVAAAAGVAGNAELPAAGRWAVVLGAVLFFVSDLFVARDRFAGRDIANRRVGLPLYYAAQFLIAGSIGWLAG